MENIQGFKLVSDYAPAGDQPKAIEALHRGLLKGDQHQTLLGVTGSGKTFTAANVIAKWGKPALVIAHNKTLAAQLAAEYREFFPENAVHYFVSYYDFYQPEAYVPISDTYIEKEAQINEDIERLRHAATQALLTRRDVIVVASVSCIYGLGSPEEYEKVNLKIERGMRMTRAEFVRTLIRMYFERTVADLSPGTFRALGNAVEVMPANEHVVYRITLSPQGISAIVELDPVTRGNRGERPSLFLFPAKHYVTPKGVVEAALADIEEELDGQLKKFAKEGKLLEADRLKRRTRQDIALIREFGYCTGIENYSRHFDRRQEGEPPHTLLSYFPKAKNGSPDFLTIVDESHVTVPQIGGMYAGDRARKNTLVEHGFRLPSAVDNRPLMFGEFEARVGPRIYTSATPGKYELEKSGHGVDPSTSSGFDNCDAIVEQIIRPTGLVDPEIIVRGVIEKGAYKGQVQDFISEAEAVTKQGMRTLVTVLTKKMAEDLAEYLEGRGVKAKYLHSDIKTIERIEILTEFRRGTFDVLVGVNLLREGLDLPEVGLVGILDADKEGFLRSETSLIQTMGRAARNVHGRVILYADSETGSIKRAIDETERRREKQLAYNKKHNITPQTIVKSIRDIMGDVEHARRRAVGRLADLDVSVGGGNIKRVIAEKKRQMREAADALDFETATIMRDEVRELEKEIEKKAKKKSS
jgi:excinuclease ABC subunit B